MCRCRVPSGTDHLCPVLCNWQVLGELLQPDERLLVAKGGKGGNGIRAPSRENRQAELAREIKLARVCFLEM